MQKFSKEDKFFMENGEVKLVIRAKKRSLKLSNKDNSPELTEEFRKWMNIKKYFNEYETFVEIRKGDVFCAQIMTTCGAELHGDHFFVALTDSRANNPLMLVAPLTSYKGRETLNPTSDLYIGPIRGIMSGKASVVVINQLQAIDKTRLLSPETLSRVDSMINENDDENEQPKMIQLKNCYRLTKEQIRKMQKSLVSYFFTGRFENIIDD